ncbi:Mov34/MPN/PAD-1 family protein [Gallibacterium anatis]|uniref:Mov34/MPN/PAD-1 family protein n=1 Tax=Gallibacterium anatis TaxID=750 RepID=A0A930UUQ4_9PAST|nr:Mov34/MPN/PAD-1 family protein [Gallibacterium anatis]
MTPKNYFEISSDDYLEANHHDGIVAIVHSHPNGKPILSTADRQMQLHQGWIGGWFVMITYKSPLYRTGVIRREFLSR